jgi:ArsR family metal-binding transcriptional regulator
MKRRKKIRVTISLNPEIVADAKRIAGLVPFSRYIEHLLIQELAINRVLIQGAKKK